MRAEVFDIGGFILPQFLNISASLVIGSRLYDDSGFSVGSDYSTHENKCLWELWFNVFEQVGGNRYMYCHERAAP